MLAEPIVMIILSFHNMCIFIILYILNFYSDVCQLLLSKTGKNPRVILVRSIILGKVGCMRRTLVMIELSVHVGKSRDLGPEAGSEFFRMWLGFEPNRFSMALGLPCSP